MLINPNFRTLKRRSGELAKSTGLDPDAQALLLFYAAECGLKALYMATYSLRTASDSTVTMDSAISLGHQLDRIVSLLKISPRSLPPRPAVLRLKNGAAINVQHLHEAWRYGEKVENHAEAVAWLVEVVKYVHARL